MALTVRLARRITIEKPVAAQDSKFRAYKPTWKTLARVWAERLDMLPSRSEAVRNGLTQGRQQVRYRIRWRADVDSSMRIREGTKLYQIVAGPAEIGRHEYMELMAEAYTTDGSA